MWFQIHCNGTVKDRAKKFWTTVRKIDYLPAVPESVLRVGIEWLAFWGHPENILNGICWRTLDKIFGSEQPGRS